MWFLPENQFTISLVIPVLAILHSYFAGTQPIVKQCWDGSHSYWSGQKLKNITHNSVHEHVAWISIYVNFMPQSENLGDSRRIRPITCSCLIPGLFTVMSHYIPTPLWNNDEQFRLAGVDSFTPTKSSFTKRVTGIHLHTVGNLSSLQIP